ncbi:DNA-directed RNA polymerases I, II, and III subunit RPABC1 [Ditylenchus destructor]|uniref:DNA-directed RNA polymerases I, II, and III subunit RPABC1 n=1 Tax=Ditylenchus destructor TaxID=166010 RepID=A0AAD4RA34_9BILA|nr:DNA-directed RNA polymerases I, II, and III subunit RPABC1 [Ditylenchus destructor]
MSSCVSLTSRSNDAIKCKSTAMGVANLGKRCYDGMFTSTKSEGRINTKMQRERVAQLIGRLTYRRVAYQRVASDEIEMIVEEDCDCFRLWRLRTTALQMCYDRGYSVSHEELNQSLTAFKYLYGDRPSRNDLTIQVSNANDASEKIFVFFPNESRVEVNFINDAIQKMRTFNSTKAIIIIGHSISTQAKELVSTLSDRFTFELVPEAELVGNVTDSDFLPEGISNDEKADLLTK